MTRTVPRNVLGLLVCLAIVAGAAALAFGPVVNNGLLGWDDQVEIYQARALNTAHPDFFYAWKQPVQEIYKPVTGTVWWALSKLAYHPEVDNDLNTHLRAKPFHVASLVAHALAGCMLFLLLRQLTGNALAALIGAVFFVVHPLQTEAVAWASGLKDVLAGMFLLAALWQYAVGAQAEHRGRLAAYLTATLLFVLAMLSKPSAVAAPAVAMVIDVIFLKRSWRQSLRWLGPWLLLAIPIILIGRLNQDTSMVPSPWWFRPVVALDALAWHLRKTVWPWPMGIDYGRTPPWLLQAAARYFTWIVPVAVAGLAALLWKRACWLAGGLAIMAALLMPVLGLVPFSYEYYSTVADHYMYAAMSGVAILLASAFARLPARWRKSLAGLAPLALVGLAIASRQQAALWRNNQTLFTATLHANPNSFAGHRGLGHLYVNANDLPNAEMQFQAALQVKPDNAGVNYDLGLLLMKTGHPAQAVEHFRMVARADPTLAQAHFMLYTLLSQMGQSQPAAQEAGLYHQLLGEQFLEVGDWPHAKENFLAALKCDPANVRARAKLDQLLARRVSSLP